nr:malectin domain-containing carbohydrate-binding protein [Sphingomonas sp. dw_22]
MARLFRAAALLLALLALPPAAQARDVREDRLVEGGWRSAVFDADAEGRMPVADGFEHAGFDDRAWTPVSVPHNWQGYSYDRQVVKGARHGTAWYRTHLKIAAPRGDERVFLMLEGAASYAAVWLNGKPVGRHGGGLVSFTLDVTDAVKAGDNLLAVRTDNPADIQDLPWTSGDDGNDGGCCEGSQPFGIFRPVHVIRTSALRVRPFGIYAWGEIGNIDAARADLTARAEIENLSARPRAFDLVTQMIDPEGRVVAEQRAAHRLAPGESGQFDHALPRIPGPRLWSPASPTLYTLRTRLMENGRVVDEASTPYGIRTVEIRVQADGSRRLYLNGAPFVVRGIAEYEHLLGGSHAFSPEQVAARVGQVEAAGFNAFRDGHYPHNFRYGDKLAKDGVLWWTQFSAHLWFDSAAFRASFKSLMTDWVRERRNNPAVFLWGLQNESRLPPEFAQEMVAVIRQLDPTASKQRLVTTCNGGDGADWNVPQNWSGTYGGDPDKYGDELIKQALVGEYGAWRSLELHGEPPYADGVLSETRMAALMQKKARLAESVGDRSVGEFHWLLATHENPGRPMRSDGTQIWDGVRELDHIGPANNKGLMTLWGEPLDVYYMFRARQVPASVSPMVYIVSHTWPDRWSGPGVKSGIEVYSNCDEVELFNDPAGRISLGRKRRDGEERFRWDGVDVRYDTLAATCLVDGAVKARDTITLDNLPPAPDSAAPAAASITARAPGAHYIYRVNVGGPETVDAAGNVWLADRHLVPGARWGWQSWADAYPDLDPQLGSRRKTFDRIEGTDAPALFQSFRYGRDRLRYSFAVPDGSYRIELYFVEPWYGRAGIDARGWRLFDVAVNGRTLIRDLDIFKEAGFDHALRKVVTARAEGGKLVIDFPRVAAGQAILAAVAIASDKTLPAVQGDGTDLIAPVAPSAGEARSYLDNGDSVFAKGDERWSGLSHELLDSDWVRPVAGQAGGAMVTVRVEADLYLPIVAGAAVPPGWQDSPLVGAIGDKPHRFVTRRAKAGESVPIPAGVPVLVRRDLVSPYAPGAFSFSRDKGLTEAEAGTVAATNATVRSAIKGYGGQGYVLLGEGAARLGWKIQTGLAGRHRFTIRYALPQGRSVAATLVLRDASGIVAASAPVRFEGSEGWQSAAAETAAMINAGDYSASLEVGDGAGLAIDSLRLD